MRKKIMFTLAILAVIGVGLYFYMYKGHRNIAAESADFRLTVSDLQQQFSANPTAANKKYADKTLEVSGKVTAVDTESHSLTIDERLSAVLTDSVMNGIALQQKVKIKGRFVGYDDLLEEFKVDQVSISE